MALRLGRTTDGPQWRGERRAGEGRVVEYLEAFGFDVDDCRPTGARMDGLDRVSAASTRRLGLRHAERLERDVGELGSADRPLAVASPPRSGRD